MPEKTDLLYNPSVIRKHLQSEWKGLGLDFIIYIPQILHGGGSVFSLQI